MVDGYIYIAYFPGLDGVDTEDSFINKSPEEAVKFWKRMRKKYPHRLAVFDSAGNRMADTVLDGLLPGSMVIRNGELWMLEKPDEDVEQDYPRLFRG
jgi:hypothetical protein